MSTKNEPETLCVAWLSGCQGWQFRHDMFMLIMMHIRKLFIGRNEKRLEKLIEKLAKRTTKKLLKKNARKFANKIFDGIITKSRIKKIIKCKRKTKSFDVMIDYINNNSHYVGRPIVGAVAVKYPENYFSVFIGISMHGDEPQDISYIKSMGQRTTEGIARGIFPQFSDMKYHS